jgi:hypothetical protein
LVPKAGADAPTEFHAANRGPISSQSSTAFGSWQTWRRKRGLQKSRPLLAALGSSAVTARWLLLWRRGAPGWAEHRALLPQRHAPVRAVTPPCLPESAQLGETPLMGFIGFPFVDIGLVRPLPAGRNQPLARSCHTSHMFRPCRSSRLRRFSPHMVLQVCCTLQPTWGSFSFQRVQLTPLCLSLNEVPFEAFPSLTASTCHQGCPCSPRFVPPRRCLRTSASLRVAAQKYVWSRASTSRLCSIRESVVNE